MRSELGGQSLHFQNRISRSVIYRRETIVKRTANHGCDQLIHVGILGVLSHYQVTISKNRDLITDFEDLIHLVRDVNHTDSLISQLSHHIEQFVDFRNGKR